MDKILSKFSGCLIGTAVGDSLGARREGSAEFVEVADRAPRYTESTAMTVAVAESLAECNDFPYWHMAERLLKKYEQEPWRRYGHTIARVFRLMRNGKLGFGMIDRDLYADGSYGNGAAMRVAPVGLMYHDDPGCSVTSRITAPASPTAMHGDWKVRHSRPVPLLWQHSPSPGI